MASWAHPTGLPWGLWLCVFTLDCSCNACPHIPWLRTTHMYYFADLEVSPDMGLKGLQPSVHGQFPPELWWENPLLPHPWLVAPPSVVKASRAPCSSPSLTPSVVLPSPKDPLMTWGHSDNPGPPPISRSLTSSHLQSPFAMGGDTFTGLGVGRGRVGDGSLPPH